MKNLNFKDKKVAVLGMGIEGLALVDFLIDKECDITVLDKLDAAEIEKKLSDTERKIFSQVMGNDKIVKVFSEGYLDNLKSFNIIFRSPGIPYFNPKIQEAKESGVDISSQIKLFFDLCPCKIIGVTGTKGKGTTASLIFEILKKSYQLSVISNQSGTDDKNTNNQQLITNNQPQVYLAGNIGYPAVTLLSDLKEDDIVILELSSFQLMDLEQSPHIAVVTNLLVDHLDYHKDLEEYQKAKESIIQFQTENDFAVLNRESTFDQSLIEKAKSTLKYFSSNEAGDTVVINNEVVLDPKNRNIKICNKDNIVIFGHHNLENIAAATLVADILDVSLDIIKNVVATFKGLPHRLEFVKEINGIKFINDSFATNPAPTIAALNSFFEDKILILGGSRKGADFSDLALKIAGSNTKGVVLIGDEADKIEQALIKASFAGQINKGLSNIDEIVKFSLSLASSGDVIILSPACASFGLFNNYKDRGDKFKTAVFNLKL